MVLKATTLVFPSPPLLPLLGTTFPKEASAVSTAGEIPIFRREASIPVDHVENMLALSCTTAATLLSRMNKRRFRLLLRHLMKMKKRKQSLLSTMEVTDTPVACIVTKTLTAGKEALLNVEPATRFMALKATTLVFPSPLLLPLLGTISPKEASAVSAARKTLIVKREDSTLVDHVVNTLVLSCIRGAMRPSPQPRLQYLIPLRSRVV
jgi:hypothetical protein